METGNMLFVCTVWNTAVGVTGLYHSYAPINNIPYVSDVGSAEQYCQAQGWELASIPTYVRPQLNRSTCT